MDIGKNYSTRASGKDKNFIPLCIDLPGISRALHIRPRSLTDKTMDSGSIDRRSIRLGGTTPQLFHAFSARSPIFHRDLTAFPRFSCKVPCFSPGPDSP